MIKSKLALYLLGKKEGFNMSAIRRFIHETESWTSEDWKQYHNEHISALIEHAYTHVPFYHNLMDKLGLKPSDIRSVEDLSKLPVIHKLDLIEHFEEFKADNFNSYPMIHHHTGGTTGTPCAYYTNRYSWAMNWGLKMQTFEWAGFHYGEDCLGVMAGGSLTPGKKAGWKHQLWRYVNNYYSMPVTLLTDEKLDEYYHHLKTHKIKFLRGYPSTLSTLAEYVNRTYKTLPVQAVFTTAEMLLPHQRNLMEKVFACKLYDTYGCGDGMGHATECDAHGELHVMEHCSIMQIVDDRGNEVGDNEEGEIVLTALYNFGFPFIRYAPGDRAIKSTKLCACGRQTKMIKTLVGRTADNFKLANGRVFSAFSLPIEDLTDELAQFQVVQEAKDEVSLLIIPKGEISKERINSLHDLLAYYCGAGIKVTVKVVDHIDLPSSGKMRFVVSKVKG